MEELRRSQSDLAEAIGATQEWVSRLENGRLPNPGLSAVMHACSTIDLAFIIGAEYGHHAQSRESGGEQ
jgi:transcriptional regulator with XRE-family HTH domain